MALTINPAVCGGRRKYFRDTLAFYLGTLLGGLLALTVLLLFVAAVGWVVPHLRLGIVLAVPIALGILRDLGVPVPLPYRRRQVPESLRSVLPSAAVAGVFGFLLGTGFMTFFTYSTQLAVILSSVRLNNLVEMLLVVAIFAVGKTVVVLTTADSCSLEEVGRRFFWNHRREHLLSYATAATSTALAIALVIAD